MLKLETILKLKKKIEEINEVLETMELDYLQLIDDDLFTVDLETRPHFTREYDVVFTTEQRLTRKFVIRFCEDFGLSLKDYNEQEEGYKYTFELQKDIMKSINKLEK